MATTIRGDGVAIPTTNKVVISTTVDVLDDDGNPMGFIQSLNRTDTRRVDRLRELSATSAGRTVEQSPGPEDLSVRVTGFAIYAVGGIKGSLLDRLLQPVLGSALRGNQVLAPSPQGGSLIKSINSQQVPIQVTERFVHPASPGAETGILYGDCMLTNYSHPVAIGTINIAEEVQLQPRFIE